MLLIAAEADRSPIHGLGLFARQPIRRGEPVWRFQPGFDRVFTGIEFARLPEPAQRHLARYGFREARTGNWVLDGDLAIFMNHAATPNTGAPGVDGSAETTCALRDIAAGEELTCDYRTFDSSPKDIGPSVP